MGWMTRVQIRRRKSCQKNVNTLIFINNSYLCIYMFCSGMKNLHLYDHYGDHYLLRFPSLFPTHYIGSWPDGAT